MKLPPKMWGPLPVLYGEAPDGEYYECCNGHGVVARPLRRIMNRHKKGAERREVFVQRKTGPYVCFIRPSNLMIQSRGRYVFTRVEKAVAFLEAALPLLTFYGVDPKAMKPLPPNYKPSEVINALDHVFTAVIGRAPTSTS